MCWVGLCSMEVGRWDKHHTMSEAGARLMGRTTKVDVGECSFIELEGGGRFLYACSSIGRAPNPGSRTL